MLDWVSIMRGNRSYSGMFMMSRQRRAELAHAENKKRDSDAANFGCCGFSLGRVKRAGRRKGRGSGSWQEDGHEDIDQVA